VTAALSPLDAADLFLASVAKPARLLIAISGGSDSTGLLLALSQSLGRSGRSDISLTAATIDHALRPASADEALAVGLLCQKLGVPHHIRRWDGDKPRSGLSMAAREARYGLLGNIADDVLATAIVTGHTSDDQSETILMRSTRSARDDDTGLSGMADAVLVDRRHWVVRPLLHCRRADIRSFLSRQHIGWIDDPSNEDPFSERARIRQQLADDALLAPQAAQQPAPMPVVDGSQQLGQGQASEHCGQGHAPATTIASAAGSGMASIVGSAAGEGLALRPGRANESETISLPTGGARRQALSLASASLLHKHASAYAAAVVQIGPPGLDADPAVLRHAIAHLTAVLGGRSHPPGRDSMDRVLAFIATGLPGRITAGRVMFDRRRVGLFMLREHRDIPRLVLAPGAAGLWDGRIWLQNTLAETITIAATAASEPSSGLATLPPGIAARAARILPRVEMSNSGDDVTTRVPQQPALGPYDRFLPRFDLALANQIAALLGRTAYLAPPC